MRLQESGVDEAGEGKGTQRLSRLAFLGLLCLLSASFLLQYAVVTIKCASFN